MHDIIEQWVNGLAGLITIRGAVLAPIFALLAGTLTSLSPCCLSTVPLIVGYVGGTAKDDTGKAFRLSLTFAGGMTLTFTAMGAVASLVGMFMGDAGKWWYFFLGVLMMMMALQTWEIFQFIPSTFMTSKNKRRGYIGALLAGILGGVFSTPCATPMLIVLLGIVTQTGNVFFGGVLLLFYSAGHSVLVIIAGTSYGFVGKLKKSNRYDAFSKGVKIVTGVFILLIGFYMFYESFAIHS